MRSSPWLIRKRPLVGAKIRWRQRCIRADPYHQRHIRKVKPFGQNLRTDQADQNIPIDLDKIAEYPIIVLAGHRIAVKLPYPCTGQLFCQAPLPASRCVLTRWFCTRMTLKKKHGISTIWTLHGCVSRNCLNRKPNRLPREGVRERHIRPVNCCAFYPTEDRLDCVHHLPYERGHHSLCRCHHRHVSAALLDLGGLICWKFKVPFSRQRVFRSGGWGSSRRFFNLMGLFYRSFFKSASKGV